VFRLSRAMFPGQLAPQGKQSRAGGKPPAFGRWTSYKAAGGQRIKQCKQGALGKVGKSSPLQCAKSNDCVTTKNRKKTLDQPGEGALSGSQAAERQTPNAERQTPRAKRRTPNAERQTPNAERLAPNAERRTPNVLRQDRRLVPQFVR
jgi:hypothetical protein